MTSVTQKQKKHMLFICSANMHRSPTAEELVNHDAGERYLARSAGTNTFARMFGNGVTQGLIDWADVVFVMSEEEDKHLTYLRKRFDLHDTAVHVLGIPDIYRRNEPELVSILKERLAPHLEL